MINRKSGVLDSGIEFANFGGLFGGLFSSSFSATSPIRNKKKVGRNDPCPCGSNKKYKKCCISRNTH